jgi:hypothetical protein
MDADSGVIADNDFVVSVFLHGVPPEELGLI